LDRITMARQARCTVIVSLAAGLLGLALTGTPSAAKLTPAVRERIIAAAVELAVIADDASPDSGGAVYLPVGSGTIISPDGLILTNWHVVDLAAQQQTFAQHPPPAASGVADPVVLRKDRVLVLTSDGMTPPVPAYQAQVVAHDATRDLAVVRITGDARGQPLDLAAQPLPFVRLGTGARLQLGDPLAVLSYPSIGGGLTYTTGVVSGFATQAGLSGVAWITTDAILSGGSSGGTVVDRRGFLIGVATAGSSLDCRPGDTNGDGVVDARDVGCVASGGSIGQVRPIDQAQALLRQAGFVAPSPAQTGTPTPAPTATLAPDVAGYCASAPIYPTGTRVVVVAADDVSLLATADAATNGMGTALDPGQAITPLPPGALLTITGPYVETGVCDRWPVAVVASGQRGFVDESVIRSAEGG
jgi:S1-C subfamily serine protease